MKKSRFESAFITDSDGRWMGLVSRQHAEAAVDRWRAGQPAS